MKPKPNKINLIFTDQSCLSREQLVDLRRDRLGDEEAHRAEIHLIDCPLCAAAMEGLTALNDPEDFLILSEPRDFLILIDPENKTEAEPKKETKTIRFQPRWWAAAAIVLLLVTAGIFLSRESNISPQAASSQIFTTPYDPVQTVAGSLSEEMLRKTRTAFLAQRYEEVLSYEHWFSPENPNQLPAQFYFAQSYLYLKKYAEAENLLLKIKAQDPTGYGEQAEWLQGQVLLEQDKTEAAKALFGKIAAEKQHMHAEDAAQALKTLRQVQ